MAVLTGLQGNAELVLSLELLTDSRQVLARRVQHARAELAVLRNVRVRPLLVAATPPHRDREAASRSTPLFPCRSTPLEVKITPVTRNRNPSSRSASCSGPRWRPSIRLGL